MCLGSVIADVYDLGCEEYLFAGNLGASNRIAAASFVSVYCCRVDLLGVSEVSRNISYFSAGYGWVGVSPVRMTTHMAIASLECFDTASLCVSWGTTKCVLVQVHVGVAHGSSRVRWGVEGVASRTFYRPDRNLNQRDDQGNDIGWNAYSEA